MKRKLFALLIALAMALSLFACNKTDTNSGNNSAPVEIEVAFSVVANGLDPISEDINTTISVTNHIYDRLVELDVNFNQVPGVAKTWRQVDDFNWEFEINLDFVFQNGENLTMDDVVYSIERLANIPKSQDVGVLVESVTYNGNILTIKTTEHNNSIIPRLLDMGVIVNKEYVEANGNEDAQREAVFMKPIGTGPYKVTEFIPGTTVVLETWDGYPFTKPQIDKITITAIPDAANRYIAVESGQIQYAGLITAMEVELAQNNPALSVYRGNSSHIIPFGFNCEREPFDNVNIRRAIIHALDLDSICALNGGRDKVGSMLFPGFSDLYMDSPGFPEFDLDRAREILEAEGYTTDNPLTMETLYFRPDPGIELFQSDLRKVGVDLVTNLVEFSVFLTKEGPGDFDGLWTSNPNRGGTWLTDLDRFDYDNFLGMRDLARWRNQRAQEIIAEMRTENNMPRLRELSLELNTIIGNEVPIVGVFYNPILSVMTNNLTGVEIKPNLQQNFRNASYNP